MNHFVKLTCIVVLLSHVGLAAADLSRGPDPYAPGYGFDRPEEAVWGGWTRGDEGCLYAEWDVFNDASHGTPTDRTAAPDVGSVNATEAYLGWNSGTIVAGSGNLYRHAAAQHFEAYVAGQPVPDPVRAVLQIETTGWELDYTTIALNGEAPTFQGVTFHDTVATHR